MRSHVTTLRRVAPALIAAVLLVACTASVEPSTTVTTSPRAPTTAGARPTAEPTPITTASPTAGPTTAPTLHPTPLATPTATAAPLPPSSPEAGEIVPQPFAMNLFRKGDYVAQHTFDWCVGASLQMTLNMATDESHSSRADQRRLWEMARDRSFSPFGGANPRGWTAALNDLGVGPYELVSLPTFDEAVTAAAEAIRATARPVGLVMWAGRHAWVMSGFESTADPLAFDDFQVTGMRVLDPLYPYVNKVWGPSAKPNQLVTPEALARQFVLRDSTHVDLGVPPGYLLVLPITATG